MKFKVGDTVRIRNNLKVSESLDVVGDMLQYENQVTRIVEIDLDFSIAYRLSIDKGFYRWDKSLLTLTQFLSPYQKWERSLKNETITV